MTANGGWYIHYSAKDSAPTQKFNILHELFEIIKLVLACRTRTSWCLKNRS